MDSGSALLRSLSGMTARFSVERIAFANQRQP
jgi:hypothetical protein